jgi:glycosyltransferase involved in cell wall biosynthesis
MSKPKLCLVTTVPMSFATLLEGQPRFLADSFDVSLVCGPGPHIEEVEEAEGMEVHQIPLTRQITPKDDAIAVAKLTSLLRRIKPDIVQTYTPKAGLVGMAAAATARVPIRVHGVVGMPLMEARGRRAAMLQISERTTYRMATHLTCNSFELRNWIHEHLTKRPITVIGNGSINGVDVDKFSQSQFTKTANTNLRRSLGIKPSEMVFLFVGRVVRDKGVEELITAFTRLAKDHPKARLLMVGDYEPELDPLSPEVDNAIRNHPGITETGWVNDVRPYIALSHCFVIPSYREGLPNSLIEAGSMGLPSVATDINGCNEVVIPGANGDLVPKKDAAALEAAMRRMIEDPTYRETLQRKSRESIVSRFAQREYFWPELLKVYQGFLAE